MLRRIACVALMLLLCAAAARAQQEAPVRRPHYIALIGLTNLHPGTDTDWIGEGAARDWAGDAVPAPFQEQKTGFEPVLRTERVIRREIGVE